MAIEQSTIAIRTPWLSIDLARQFLDQKIVLTI